MSVQNIYWNFISGFYANDTYGSWSVDLNIPSQTVYASANLSEFENNDWGGVYCGISQYVVLVDGLASERIPPVMNNGVAPAIWDDNVVIVTYTYGAQNGLGSCNFQILGFG